MNLQEGQKEEPMITDGNMQDMKTGIWSAYHHIIKPVNDIPLEEQHKFCPKNEHTWCKLWFGKLQSNTNKIT